MGEAAVKCTMTMAGCENLAIPVGSFEVFKRRDGMIGIQVVTRRADLAGAIADRAKGYITVTVDVNGKIATLGTAKVSKIRMDEGPINRSITIQAAG